MPGAVERGLVVVRTTMRTIGSEPAPRDGQPVPEAGYGDNAWRPKKTCLSIGETSRPALPARGYDPGRFAG
jgi:hypothetical protein